MDLRITEWINGFAGRSVPLDAVGIFLATGLVSILVIMVAWWFMRQLPALRRRHAIVTVATVLLAYALSQLIGALAFRERPFVRHAIHQLIAKEVTEKSFPSDHATIAFALAFPLLLAGTRRWGSACVVLAVLVGIGRVFVGVHYPSDVLGGAALAFVVAVVVRTWVRSWDVGSDGSTGTYVGREERHHRTDSGAV